MKKRQAVALTCATRNGTAQASSGLFYETLYATGNVPTIVTIEGETKCKALMPKV